MHFLFIVFWLVYVLRITIGSIIIKDDDKFNKFKVFNSKSSVIIWFIPSGYFYTIIRFLIHDL